MKGRIAYCAVPRAGGIFAHYRALRQGLAPAGWDVRAVCAGRKAAGLWQTEFVDDGCVRLADAADDPLTVARTLMDWCMETGIAILYMNGADYSLPAWNMIRHAPASLRAISRTYASTPFSYRAALIHPDRLSAVVATSRRQYHDVQNMDVRDAARIRLIPHAVHPEFLRAGDRSERANDRPLRLGFAGRLNEPEKGVFRLPGILRRLDQRGVAWTLDVAGDGPDASALFQRFERNGQTDRITRHGRLPRAAVAACLAQCDVFLLTSHHEGFGIALIEAMASGAVPVAFHIADVTDWIVEDGQSGYIIEPGDGTAMADAIARLDADRPLLQRMSRTAQQAVRDRFHPDTMAQAYDHLFTTVMNEEFRYDPLPWSAFTAAHFPRSPLNRLIHSIVPRSFRGRAGRWAHRFSP